MAPAVAWVRAHLTAVIAIAGGLAIAIVLLIVAVGAATGGGSGKALAPGTLVGTGPLTTGYRVAGVVKKRTDASLVVAVASVDAAASEARNVVLRSGVTVEFDQPAEGTVALSRNGHSVTGPSKLHVGDKVVLVGQFTSVVLPPGAPHDGYAYFAVEATS